MWYVSVHGGDLCLLRPTLGPPKNFQCLTRVEETDVATTATQFPDLVPRTSDYLPPLWADVDHWPHSREERSFVGNSKWTLTTQLTLWNPSLRWSPRLAWSRALVFLYRMLTIFACYVFDFYVLDAASIFNHLPRMFLSTDFAFRIKDWTCCHEPHLHAILRIISWGISGLATDSPCGVWGRGWTLASCMIVHFSAHISKWELVC